MVADEAAEGQEVHQQVTKSKKLSKKQREAAELLKNKAAEEEAEQQEDERQQQAQAEMQQLQEEEEEEEDDTPLPAWESRPLSSSTASNARVLRARSRPVRHRDPRDRHVDGGSFSADGR